MNATPHPDLASQTAWPIEPSSVSSLMPGDYDAMRQRFLAAARDAGARIVEYPHPLKGPRGEALATDMAFLGNADATNLLVTISGTHGVEGAFGSACQTQWFSRQSAAKLPPNTAVLAIHLINPWGTAWSRRVNEDNVDLNRNFIDWSGPTPGNDAYAELHAALPGADIDETQVLESEREFQHLCEKRGGYARLAPIVEAGQYQHADGLFYGGNGPVWSNTTLMKILAEHASNASEIVAFDLHTGAGPYGYPALLAVAETENPDLEWGHALFGPALTSVITGAHAQTQTGIAATATGYVSAALRRALADRRILPLVIECGTLPADKVAEAVRMDNWLHRRGALGSAMGQEIKSRLRQAFIPDDETWQRHGVEVALSHFDKAFRALTSPGTATAAQPVPARAASPETRTTSNPAVERLALEANGIRKRFGPLEVLSGVSLHAKVGQVVSMIGSSGSGKSTFLRCINLLEQPNDGQLIIDGEEIRMKKTPRGAFMPADKRQVERMRTRVGMVFQNFNLWPHMTALENIIEAPIHILKEDKAAAIDHAHALLRKVGMADKHAAYPGFLSGGQQQRVAIARTLAMRPKLMLFDEPTSALDPELVGEVLRVIRQLAEEGNTMILVTHEMQFAREVSHKVLFLHRGQVEEEGEPAEVFGNPRSERMRQFLARTF